MSRILIIGGVAGGMSTAARLRRVDEKSDIIVFERGKHVSFANCGLPYYIGNTIQEREMLLVQTPQSFQARFNVDVRTMQEVISIDRKNKKVLVRNYEENNEYTESYDKLVLSPGAEPIRPPISGVNHPRVHTIRNIPDTDAIKHIVDEEKPKRVLIVGAGFIGLEMAENLHDRGIFVTIVEMSNQVMNVLDYEMAAAVNQHLKTKGVEFYLNDGVNSFTEKNENRLTVKLSSGREIEVDMVILSAGVKPENHLAKEAGLEIGDRGGIVVNEFLQTSDIDIYALGDAIEVYHPIIHKKTLVPLAGPANKQGRIVADNIVGNNIKKFNGVIGTSIAKVFDLTVGVTGATEKLLKQENITYESSITHGSSHAGYYPNALPLIIKTIFSPKDGRILGAQAVGYEGVDKRIDVFASMIQCGKTVYDLEEFEHAYAPPYSSAKDPVNIAGFVASNILEGKVNIIHWDELLNLDQKDIFILDVRLSDEIELSGTIEGSINIDLDSLRPRIKEIPTNKKIIIFCGVGLRGYLASRILMQNGYNQVYNLSGGYKTYELAIQKQDNGDIFEGYEIGLDDMLKLKQKTVPLTMNSGKEIKVNACGLQCPGPIMKVKKEIELAQIGDELVISASDPGFYNDIQAWARATGNQLLTINSEKGIVTATIKKSEKKELLNLNNTKGNDKTIVVFNDDLDKAIASFVIANGALAMGRKVTLFFTFWGLNVIKQHKKVRKLKKTLIEKMFGWMMPRGSKKLKLSKMNMGGMGKAMIKGIMKKHGVDSLESMIQSAIDSNVELIACQMSMDLMGIKKEELIPGVKTGGVAMYLEASEQADATLFI